MTEIKVDVSAIYEMHAFSVLIKRGKINGYCMIDASYNDVYGTAKYVCNGITIEVSGLNIVNVYNTKI